MLRVQQEMYEKEELILKHIESNRQTEEVSQLINLAIPYLLTIKYLK